MESTKAGCSFFRFGNDFDCQGISEVPRTMSWTSGCFLASIVNLARRLMPEELRNSRSVIFSVIEEGFEARMLIIRDIMGA
jgi:hypothetical protein